jgi:hypothetical protein
MINLSGPQNIPVYSVASHWRLAIVVDRYTKSSAEDSGVEEFDSLNLGYD